MSKFSLFLFTTIVLAACRQDVHVPDIGEFVIQADSAEGLQLSVQSIAIPIEEFTIEDFEIQNDARFLIIGSSWSALNNDDYCLAAIDSSGQLIWVNNRKSAGHDQGRFLTSLKNNNFLAGGFVFDPIENREIYIQEINSRKKIWSTTTHIERGVSDEAYNAIECNNGDVLLTGFSKANIDGFLMKLDKSGKLRFKQKYGGDHKDYLFDALELDNGDILAVGTLGGFHDLTGNDFTVANANIFLLATDRNLKEKWRQQIDNQGHDSAVRILRTPQNTVLLFGTSQQNNSSGLDMYLAECDLTGNIQWQRFYGGPDWDYGQDIIPTNNGLLLMGTSGTNPSVIKVYQTDFLGEIIAEFTIKHPFALEAKKIKYHKGRIYIAGNQIMKNRSRQAFILEVIGL